MTAERDFHAATQRAAVECRRNRLAAEFDGAHELVCSADRRMKCRRVGRCTQLGEVTVPPDLIAAAVGPSRLTLREDVVNPIPMTHGPETIAPVFIHGFFVVPKLGGMAEE